MLRTLFFVMGLTLASAGILGEDKCEIDKDFKILLKLADLETRIKTMEGSKPSCPDGWVTFKGECFLFEDRIQLPWVKAKDFCSTYGSTLAIIDSKEKDTFIWEKLDRLFKGETGRKTGFWFGAEDLKQTGIWEWYTTGIELRDGYSKWYSGQGDENTHREENCGCLWNEDDFGYLWHDCGCSQINYIVCEKRI